LWSKQKREREGFWQVALGSPSSLDHKRIGQAEKDFQDPLAPESKIPSRSPSLPLVGLPKKETEDRERKKCKARALLAEFKFEFI
jgi:hypothetical protein